MTEMVNGADQSSSNFAGTPVTTSSTPQQTAPAEAERTFKQSEVNDLVGRARHEAIERYRSDASMAARQVPPQQQQQYGIPQYAQNNAPVQHQPQPTISENDVRRMTAEEIQRSRNEWEKEAQRTAQERDAQRIATEFFQKIDAGEGGRQSFEKQVSESGVPLGSIPYHVQLANMVDNTREVISDLLKNPSKIGTIQNLINIDMANGGQTQLALAEIKKLSQSIKTNEQGSKFQSPREPLSQMRPSTAGTGSTGERSVRDYRNNPAYRV